MGHLETARVLLALNIHGRHVDVNRLDNSRHTPLYYAASKKNPAMVRLLLAHGAKVHVERFGIPVATPFQGLDEICPQREYANDEDRKEIIAMLKAASGK